MQLGINLAGLLIAGTLTLLVQQTVWRHVVSGRAAWGRRPSLRARRRDVNHS